MQEQENLEELADIFLGDLAALPVSDILSPRPALVSQVADMRLAQIPKTYSLKHTPVFYKIYSNLKKEGLNIPNSHRLKDFRKEMAARDFIKETVAAIEKSKAPPHPPAIEDVRPKVYVSDQKLELEKQSALPLPALQDSTRKNLERLASGLIRLPSHFANQMLRSKSQQLFNTPAPTLSSFSPERKPVTLKDRNPLIRKGGGGFLSRMDPKLSRWAHGEVQRKQVHQTIAPRALEAFTAKCKNESSVVFERPAVKTRGSSDKRAERKFAIDFSRKKNLMDNCLQQALTAIQRNEDLQQKKKKIAEVQDQQWLGRPRNLTIFTPKTQEFQGQSPISSPLTLTNRHNSDLYFMVPDMGRHLKTAKSMHPGKISGISSPPSQHQRYLTTRQRQESEYTNIFKNMQRHAPRKKVNLGGESEEPLTAKASLLSSRYV